MAGEKLKCLGTRKRKRRPEKKKLVVNNRVEVRSLEHGFQGSWHPGTVIRCGKMKRHVRYDNVLNDSGSDYLVDEVGVSPVLDGLSSLNCMDRGLIRPLPPLIEFGTWKLSYGLCVDVNYQEAWWEGVIFDHCDGKEERSIFFPDLGDEMKTGIGNMRITQDWDEVLETWEPRGNWVFLELVEECKQEMYVAVSVKQIWYDVRTKEDFPKIRDWTFNVKDLWRDLIKEVISEYLTLTIEEVIPVLDLPKGCMEGTLKLQSVEATGNGDLNCEVDMASYQSLVNPCDQLDCNISMPDDACPDNTFVSEIRTADCPMEKDDSTYLLDIGRNCGSIKPIQENCDIGPLEDQTLDKHITTDSGNYCLEKEVLMQQEQVPPVQQLSPDFQERFSRNGSGSACEVAGSSSVKRNRKRRESAVRRSCVDWRPLILPKAEFCPDAINLYASVFKTTPKRLVQPFVTKAQGHLLCVGWKIEWSRDNNQGFRKYRYCSPTEQVYMSLYKVCSDMIKDSDENPSLSQNDQRNRTPSLKGNLSHWPLQVENIQDSNVPVKNNQMIKDSDENPSLSQDDQRNRTPSLEGDLSHRPLEVENNQGSNVPVENNQDSNVSTETAPSHSVEVLLEPEYCPRAVVEYYMHALEKCRRADKVDMRLKAKKHLLAEGWTIYYPANRRGLLYRSPKTDTYMSLRTACRGYIKESIPKLANCGLRPLDTLTTSKENISQEDTDNLLHLISQLLQKEPDLRTTENACVTTSSGNRNMERSRNSKSSHPKRERKGANKRVLRSAKTVQKVSSPGLLHQKPQNVLSWLIDRNAVLPRDKVYYQVRDGRRPKAEGRLTRDGIKCSCCQKVYTLAGFEHHATGSSNTNTIPAARIFLEDGKSLLDCQKQILHDFKKREAKAKPCNDWCQENDYICSVCHYGGELILCDQCPSSFHKNCLGLEDIPDGDWFCPSCRCGRCGQSKTVGAEEGDFLPCGQCENKYHIRCLRKRGVDKTRRYPENWFCSYNCEKIYTGLHELLGKPIVVGANNLTWTLMKFANSDSCGVDNPVDDFLAESYSKLNVALAVMHECFEPLKEPNSTRDFMEDVLFSSRSDLNRLNFQGFYTVLLERNDELITVATVRVYGEKVAEVPLVGTRLQYRRLGMCRVLMDELEKRLMQLGVERLVLPAVPSVLDTWTTCFGFSKMTTAERSKFLDKTFLDFQDTIMCQKLLKTHCPEVQPRLHDIPSVTVSIDVDGSSTVSEVYQAGENEETEMLDHQLVENACLTKGAINPVDMDKEPTLNATSPEYPIEDFSLRELGRRADDGINMDVRCYKRRRLAGVN